jgi:hypothetical protein
VLRTHSRSWVRSMSAKEADVTALQQALQRAVMALPLNVPPAGRAKFIAEQLLAEHEGKPLAPVQTNRQENAVLEELESLLTTAVNAACGHPGWPLRAVAERLSGMQPLVSAELTPSAAEPSPNEPPAALELSVEELMRADAEAAAAAAAEEMPEDSGWEDLGGRELEPLLAHTTLIDAAWLLKLAQGEAMPEREGVVPPWQLLPPEAKVTLAELRQSQELLPVAVLSYGWASKGHPDPSGAQLKSLVPALRSMVNWCSDGCALKFGIVWDFMSLPQRGYTAGYDPEHDDRTPYQLARFGAGLKNINVWYGHRMVYTLVLDLPMPEGSENMATVDRRGWCAARAASGLCALPCPLALPLRSAALFAWLVPGASSSAGSAASRRTQAAASRSAG